MQKIWRAQLNDVPSWILPGHRRIHVGPPLSDGKVKRQRLSRLPSPILASPAEGQMESRESESNSSSAVSVFFFFFTVLVFIFFIARKKKETEPSLPPGPRGLPLLGSLPFLDRNLHVWFKTLADLHGPIFKLHLGSKLFVVLSSPEVVQETLKNNDVVFSNHYASPRVARSWSSRRSDRRATIDRSIGDQRKLDFLIDRWNRRDRWNK